MDQPEDPQKRKTLRTLMASAATFTPVGRAAALTANAFSIYAPLTVANTTRELRRYLLDFFPEFWTGGRSNHWSFLYALKDHTEITGDWNDIGGLECMLDEDYVILPPDDIYIGQMFDDLSGDMFALADYEERFEGWLSNPFESFEAYLAVADKECEGHAEFKQLVSLIAERADVDVETVKQKSLREFTVEFLMPEIKGITRILLEDMFKDFDTRPFADAHAGGFLTIADHRVLMRHFPEYADKIERSVKAWERGSELRRMQREKVCSNDSDDLRVLFIEQNGDERTYDITFNDRSKRVYYKMAELFGEGLPFLEDAFRYSRLQPQKIHSEERGYIPIEKIRLSTSVPVIQMYLDNLSSNTVRACERSVVEYSQPNIN